MQGVQDILRLPSGDLQRMVILLTAAMHALVVWNGP